MNSWCTRLTPAYAVVLAVFSTVIVYMGTGPYWYSFESAASVCRRDAWTNLLYINNLVGHECMGETWYLGMDMQFFVFSALFSVYPLWRWKSYGWIAPAVAMAGTLATNFAVYAVFEMPGVGYFPVRK